MTAKELVSDIRVGWNLGNTLDSIDSSIDIHTAATAWETAWGNPVTTKALIDCIVKKGFNVIRIPVSWDNHIFKDDNYRISDSWMNRVQEVVDYAYKNDIYVILNIHHESWHLPYYDNKGQAVKILTRVWEQIADHFQDYNEKLIFEGLNEPRKVGTPVEWNGGDKEGWDMVNVFNQVFVNTVRKGQGNNPNRMLMIPGYAANCWEGYKHIELPKNDDKIIVSVHAYEPYDFALNTQGRGLWNQDTKPVDTIMDSLYERFVSKGTPVIIGEFGALFKPVEGNEEERAAWVEYYVRKAKSVGIPCIWWDNGLFTGEGECFGLIDREKLEWKYTKVIDGLMKGLC